jgi:hypothetical protein
MSKYDLESLTTQRMARILQEIQMDIPPRQKDTPEEAEFRKELAKELAGLPEGTVVDMPKDF